MPKTQFKVIIPAGFSASNLVTSKWRADKKLAMVDAMNYIVSLCLPDILSKDRQDLIEQGAYISLNASILRDIIGPNYKEAVDLLLHAGVLETDNNYINGTKSKGYRCHASLLAQPTADVILQTRGIVTRLCLHQKVWKREQNQRSKHIQHVLKWLTADVRLDMESAHYFIEQSLHYKRNLLKTDSKHIALPKGTSQRILLRTQHEIMLAKAINNGEFPYRIDSAGRLYTPIVACKKELRNFITINGNPLASIDVTSSQPYLFQVLLKPSFWMTEGTSTSLYNINRKLYNEIKQANLLQDIIKETKKIQDLYTGSTTQTIYPSLQWTDDFYEYIRHAIKPYCLTSHYTAYFSSRAKVKKTILLIWYDSYVTKNPPYYDAFKKLFPRETLLMDIIKLAGSSTFPKILQAVEAHLMLVRVCKEITVQYPNMPYLTVHDCILIEDIHADKIATIVEEELHKHVGSKPGLKIENLGPNRILEQLVTYAKEEWNEIKSIAPQKRIVIYDTIDFSIPPLLYQLPRYKGMTLYSSRFVKRSSPSIPE